VSHSSDERGTELRDLFFESAQELLQSLNDSALRLEKSPQDLEIVREIRRTVHTLKGDAAACSFRELSEAAHELEDALALEQVPTGASLAEVAFAAADMFNHMLNAYRKHKKPAAAESLHRRRPLEDDHRNEQAPQRQQNETGHDQEHEAESDAQSGQDGRSDHRCQTPPTRLNVSPMVRSARPSRMSWTASTSAASVQNVAKNEIRPASTAPKSPNTSP